VAEVVGGLKAGPSKRPRLEQEHMVKSMEAEGSTKGVVVEV
jgi:hypothetical protein